MIIGYDRVSFELGTYALFSVLCGAASYIAGAPVQRLAIPEANPTSPLLPCSAVSLFLIT